MGDVGYPSGLSYLSLKFTHPITNASFTYDEMSISEDMKTSLGSPLKFQVSLASGLNIIIVEDDEPDSVNCTRKKENFCNSIYRFSKFLTPQRIDLHRYQ